MFSARVQSGTELCEKTKLVWGPNAFSLLEGLLLMLNDGGCLVLILSSLSNQNQMEKSRRVLSYYTSICLSMLATTS